MQNMSELWDEMENGSKAYIVETPEDIVVKDGKNLYWAGTKVRVPAEYLLGYQWELLKEEEKEIETEKPFPVKDGQYGKFIGNVLKEEIETEKWMHDGNYEARSIIYKSPSGLVFSPSNVMDQKNFLRWVGTMPKPETEGWPGQFWCVWFDENGVWYPHYKPEDGYTKQVFADYALMRVEK